MSAKNTAKKSAPVVIKAPKITTAWNKVCTTSSKSENEIVSAIENLSAVMVLESGLSVRDMKKVISDTKNTSSFVSISHVPALPTWSKLRALHADFRALPLAKQLSTASASYDLLGSGNGEQIKTLDALKTEIATMRKAKNDQSTKSAKSDTPAKSGKAPKNPLADMLAYFTALDFAALDENQQDLVAEIHATLESKMVTA